MMSCFVKRFHRADSGVSAVEFALIAPVMIITFLGIAEVANTVLAARKVANVASTAADLVAQTTTIDDAGIADVMGALSVVLHPFNASSAQVRISSVVADDDGELTIAWSDGHNIPPRAEGDPITLDYDIVPENQGIIMAEAFFTYNGIELSDTFYMKPRRSTTVQRQ